MRAQPSTTEQEFYDSAHDFLLGAKAAVYLAVGLAAFLVIRWCLP
jgi:hypothetical protein